MMSLLAACSVRPLIRSDIPDILNYWANMTESDLDRMGVDPAKARSPERLRTIFEETLDVPPHTAKRFCLIWLIEGTGVGYSTMSDIKYGESGEMHLHMWNVDRRGNGFGTVLFCLSAIEYYDRFHLKSAVCEPKSTNQMPNKMLQKVGFKLANTYIGEPSVLRMKCELNSYEITRYTAEHYLRVA